MIGRAAFSILAIGAGVAGLGRALAMPASPAPRPLSPVATAIAAPRLPVVAPQAPASPTPSSAQVAEGARLFVSYNCGDCHGAAGSGAMAPSFQDNRWHFGGSASEVFRSIAEGRPGGMPAWGAIIPGPQMVALAAYVRSLGEGRDLSTENFTGTTVERSGH